MNHQTNKVESSDSMKKQGFTLIELLAVIVILAVIALIATPIVMNTIENSRKGAAERSAENVEAAAELYYYAKRIDNNFIGATFTCSDGVCKNGEEVLEINGQSPEDGRVIISSQGNITLNSIVINGYSCYKDGESYTCEKAEKTTVSTTNGVLTLDSKTTTLSNMIIKGNSIQDGTPTLNDPVEIQSVGERTVNLFKLPEEGSSSVNLLENGLESTGNARCSIDIEKIPFEVGKKYTVKVDYENVTGVGSSGTFRLSNGSTSTMISTLNKPIQTFEATEEFLDYNKVWIYGEGTKYSNIMIVEGEYTSETFPDYEPYGYKIPINLSQPSMYTYDSFFSGDSVISAPNVSKIDDDSISIKNWYQNVYAIPNTLFKPNTTYEISKKLKIISGTANHATSRIAIATGTGSGALKLIDGEQKTNTFTTPADLTDYIYLWVYGISDGEIEINDIVIREKEPITTNIYLDEPLRKIGDDFDYIDFKSGQLVRNIYGKHLTSDMKWSATYYPTFTASLDSEYESKPSQSTTVMTKYSVNPYVKITQNEGKAIGFSASDTYWGFEKLDDLKTWLDAHPDMVAYYPLKTPMITPLNLPEININKGVSNITIGTTIKPSEVIVDYYK